MMAHRLSRIRCGIPVLGGLVHAGHCCHMGVMVLGQFVGFGQLLVLLPALLHRRGGPEAPAP